jgi:hypothetical protein
VWTPKCAGCVIEHAKAIKLNLEPIPGMNDATTIVDGRALSECHINVLTPEEEADLRRQQMQQQIAAAQQQAAMQQAAKGGLPMTDEVAQQLRRNGTRLIPGRG